MTKILILCTGNSCRSQMAAAFLRHWKAGEIFSAGTLPATEVHPLAIRVMAEAGIDISSEKPVSVNHFLNDEFDFVITVCSDADENCPLFTGKVKNRLHLGFEDPAEATGTDSEKLEVFRQIRKKIWDDFKLFAINNKIGIFQ